MPHVLPVTIYYEDTDFSGMVYHPNYLKYFERAREELLGVERLAELWRTRGHGFVVYRVEMRFKDPGVHGDRLEVHTIARAESDYRLFFEQSVVRPGGKVLVTGVVEMVTVDKGGKLVPIPPEIAEWVRTSGEG